MPGQDKILGEQVDVVDLSDDIATDRDSIGNITAGMLSDPSSIAAFDSNYLRRDGTVTMDGTLILSGINDLNVGGNITVSGTLDGRDIAVDGTTLDAHVAAATLHFTEANIVHQNISGAGTNTHADIDTHITSGSPAIHFTETSIDHVNILSVGTNTHADIDAHITSGSPAIHFTETSIVHQNISGAGINTHADIDAHISLGSPPIHFTEASIVHQNISGAGTNTHAGIDAHLGSVSLHFTEANIDHTNIQSIGTNSHAAIDTHVGNGTLHFTEASIVHQNILGVGTNTHPTIDLHIANTSLHFTTLTGLSDVDTSGAAAGQVLTYSTTPVGWFPQTIAGVTNPMTADLDTDGYLIQTADVSTGSNAKDLVLRGGNNTSNDTRDSAGNVRITGGSATDAANTGTVTITGGAGASDVGGGAALVGGSSTTFSGGGTTVAGGATSGTDTNGGDVSIEGGGATGVRSQGGNVEIRGGGSTITGSPPLSMGGSVEIFPGLGVDGDGSIDIHSSLTVLSIRQGEGILRIVRDDANVLVGSVGLTVPVTTNSHIVFVLPNTDGSNGDVLQTDGSGNLTFAAGGGGGGNNWVSGNGGIDFSSAPTSGTPGGLALAAGYNSTASGTSSLAIGAYVRSTHAYATSIGGYTYSGADYQTNIGYGIYGEGTAYRTTIGYGGFTGVDAPNSKTSVVTIYGNGKVEPIGAEAMFVAPPYTIATLPVVVEGGIIYVSDAVASTGIGSQCFGRLLSGSPPSPEWIDVTTSIAVV